VIGTETRQAGKARAPEQILLQRQCQDQAGAIPMMIVTEINAAAPQDVIQHRYLLFILLNFLFLHKDH
jgi:hypothetical protein